MEHIGAGLAAMGVIGPGIGIGILAGMAAGAIGRNPDAAGQIRGLAIILAGAFLLSLTGMLTLSALFALIAAAMLAFGALSALAVAKARWVN